MIKITLFSLLFFGIFLLITGKLKKNYHRRLDLIHQIAETNRTAAIITGQLRSGNISWTSGWIRQNAASNMFGGDDPPTPIRTILEWLFKLIISQGGGLDVFMYMQAHPEQNNSLWDGNSWSYYCAVGDTRCCEPFLETGLFEKNTNNSFFCLVEPEVQLMTPFIWENPRWKHYHYGTVDGAREQFLQQLYAMYRGNLAAKQYAMNNNFQYKYKVRVRPDVALTRPAPEFQQFQFNDHHECRGNIYYPNRFIMRSGSQDSFNIGLTEHMDLLLDRYLEFISEAPFPIPEGGFNAEIYLLSLMKIKYNICMISFNDMWMVPIRSNNHPYTPMAQVWRPEVNNNQWKQVYISDWF